MDPVHIILLTLIAGLALIVAEIFLPTGGALTVMSAASLLFSCFMAWKQWSDSSLVWVYYGFVLFAIPATVVGTLYIMPFTKLGNKILLEAPKTEEVTPDVEVQAKLHALVGSHGLTTTPVRPSGMVEVNGEKYHCESRGLLIESGVDVEILAVKGNRLVVRIPQTDTTDINATAADAQPKPVETEISRPETNTHPETTKHRHNSVEPLPVEDEKRQHNQPDTVSTPENDGLQKREASPTEESLDFDIPTN